MSNKIVKCGKLNISNSNPFVLIAGPCQLETEKHAIEVASELKKMTEKLNLGLIYKEYVLVNRLVIMFPVMFTSSVYAEDEKELML